ncbi:MAG: hypothetical protein K2X98_01795 [Alphaproteobacteria bacterium]|nr:hypothetical protein [Alphaproteobacteria bacterium]
MIKILLATAFQFMLFFSNASLFARYADLEQDAAHLMPRPLHRNNQYLTALDQQALDIGNNVKTYIQDYVLTANDAVQYRHQSGILPLTHLFMQEPTHFKALKIYEMHRDNGEDYMTAMMRGVFFALIHIRYGHHPLAGLEQDAPLFMREFHRLEAHFNPFDIAQMRKTAAGAA